MTGPETDIAQINYALAVVPFGSRRNGSERSRRPVSTNGHNHSLLLLPQQVSSHHREREGARESLFFLSHAGRKIRQISEFFKPGEGGGSKQILTLY